MPVRLGLPLLAAIAVVSLTFGWVVGHQVDGDNDLADVADAASEADTSDPPAPTTTIDPDRPSAERPLRVVLAGDSVMAGLTPPLAAALESEGASEVRFVLTPSILRDATVRFTWQRELDQFNPDVIVMFVGTWELGEVSQGRGQAVGPDNPGWRAAYDAEVLDPWIDFITGNGADVIWIGTPAVDNEQVNESFVPLNEAFEDTAERWDEVTYVDGGRILGHPADGYPGGEALLFGSPLRTRQIDGLHLCPDGAVILAADVLEVMVDQFDVPVAADWDDGSWRTDASFPVETCPNPV